MKILHYFIITIFTTSLVIVNNPIFADDSASYGDLTGYRQAYFQGNHGSYPIWYKLTNGTVVSTLLDLPAKALLFEINTTSNGQLTVELPRTIIDSKNGNEDVPYFAGVYDIRSLGGPMKITPEEINNNDMRILKINFTKDITEIEIVGTFFVEKYHYVALNSVSSLSPLKQYETGLAAKDVICKSDFQLVIKSEDNSPACVKITSIHRLVLLHWALKPIDKLTVEEFKDTYKAGEKIDFVMKFQGFYACGYPSALVKNVENKTIWQSPVELTLCDPDTGYGEYKWKFGELYNVILNQTGSYYVDISFSDQTIDKEFEIK